MARSHDPLTESQAVARVHGICFKTGPPRRLGVELEWLVHDLHDPPPGPDSPRSPLPPARFEAALRALRATPLHSALTVEPGGQLELSSAPATSLVSCVRPVAHDLAAVRAQLSEHGLALVGHGLEPCRSPRRLRDLPRYRAMEEYFDRTGPAGRVMMCSSASVQVCVDAGTEEPGPTGYARRWLLGHLLGAVLLAAFANSPLRHGRPSGWRSTRQAVWSAIDGGRTLAPPMAEQPRAAWTAYALDAPVLCVRAPGDGPWTVPSGTAYTPNPPSTVPAGTAYTPNPPSAVPAGTGFTFRQWLRGAGPRPPAPEDLDYHLSTLFPPVRPRGHLELRMIDAQPGEYGWLVPLAVTAALFDDPAAAESAYRTVKPLADIAGARPAPRNPLWQRAARHGPADPELRAAAQACFAVAREALPRLGAGPEILAAVDGFTARYLDRGRCPADDVLDACTEHAGTEHTGTQRAGSEHTGIQRSRKTAATGVPRESRP